MSTSEPAKPRTKPAEVRREELLDAAQALFIARGVPHTSIDEIVAAAEVAKGTFYLHFRSKEQLLTGLQQRFLQRFCGDMQRAVDACAPDDWHGRLRAWVAGAVNGYIEHLPLHDVVFHHQEYQQPHSTEGNPVIEQFAEFLEEGRVARAWGVKDCFSTAVFVFHGMHGMLDAAVKTQHPVQCEPVVRVLEEFICRVVGVAQAGKDGGPQAVGL